MMKKKSIAQTNALIRKAPSTHAKDMKELKETNAKLVEENTKLASENADLVKENESLKIANAEDKDKKKDKKKGAE